MPLPPLPQRRPDSHKGDFGTALLFGGSRRMSGAIALAGIAALRSGAGLVRLAVPESAQPMVAGHEPSYMTVPLAEDESGQLVVTFPDAAGPQSGPVQLGEVVAGATALACGPGLGRNNSIDQFVAWLFEQVETPAVFDADGLNALARQPDVLSRGGGPRVLTPHVGELRRLLGTEVPPEPEQRYRLAERLATKTATVVVLKGRRTLITDGVKSVVNTTGNPGMATGGTGDVLTGVIAALLAQGLAAWDAARLGVYVHGLAGDLAAQRQGQIGMIASDVAKLLPQAFQQTAELPQAAPSAAG